MKITVLDHKNLENIPSGSGIAKSGDMYYVIGDDSPYLFLLNEKFETIGKTRLMETENSQDERIVKAKKPDFETLEIISENELVIFGSGSKSPERDVFISVLIGENMLVEKYNITNFYSELKNLNILSNSELNIEATAFSNNQLYLFNRKKNVILKFDYPALRCYIKGETAFPIPETKEFNLPKINGIEAGFSGATVLKNEAKIIFSASIENTDNAYDDGEILGSIIGTIDLSDNKIGEIIDFCNIPNTNEFFKVESVTVKNEISTTETQVVLITDDDKGHSIVLECLLLR